MSQLKFAFTWSLIFLYCFGCYAQNDYKKEIDSLHALVEDPSRSDLKRAKDYVELSSFYFRQNIDTVVTICIKGINFINTCSNSRESSIQISKSKLWMNIGFTYYYLNKLDQSIEAFYKSLAIAENHRDLKTIADVKTNIANVEIDLEELESAERNLKQVLLLQNELRDSADIGRTLNTLGYIYRISGDNNLALDHYKRALYIRIASKDRIGEAACYNNIAYIHRSGKHFEKAIEYYDKAIAIYEEENALNGIALLYGNRANCYLEIDEIEQALSNAHRGYNLATKQGSKKDLMYLSEVLYTIYKERSNYKLALHYFQEFNAYKDSATSQKHYKELINQKLQYEYKEKEKILALEHEQETLLKEKEHTYAIERSKEENNKLYFIIVTVSILLLVVIGFLVYLNKQKRVIQRQSKELELIALRTQMNPHFLFNSLNSIKLSIIENDKELSTHYLTKFSKLVRLILENSNKSLISLEDELETTKLYLELEQLRFKNKFQFKINTNADILIELPPLVLQPYVENAIWHGIMHLDGGGLITIRTYEDKHGICIEIEDNGIGRKKATEITSGQDQKQSMGMDITQKRIQALNEITGVKPIIKIVDLEEDLKASGTLVKISIPFYE